MVERGAGPSAYLAGFNADGPPPPARPDVLRNAVEKLTDVPAEAHASELHAVASAAARWDALDLAIYLLETSTSDAMGDDSCRELLNRLRCRREPATPPSHEPRPIDEVSQWWRRTPALNPTAGRVITATVIVASVIGIHNVLDALGVGWLGALAKLVPETTSLEGALVLLPAWLPVLAWVWFALLVVSWLRLRALARENRVDAFIDLGEKRWNGKGLGAIYGAVQPFSKDAFYTIHQFIFIPFALFAMITISQASHRLDELFEQPSAQVIETAQNFTDFVTHPAWLVLAVAIATFSAMKQFTIQQRRCESDLNVFWWDHRIMPKGWWIRLVMVWLDWFILPLFMVSLAAIVMLLVKLGIDHELPYDVSAPDAMGGLEDVGVIILWVATTVAVLGTFAVSSVLLHRGMAQYHLVDVTSSLAYLVFACLVTATPLWGAHQTMDDARDEYVGALEDEIGDRVARISSAPAGQSAAMSRELAALQIRRDAANELAAWPFDTELLGRAIAIILSPFGLLLVPLIEHRVHRSLQPTES